MTDFFLTQSDQKSLSCLTTFNKLSFRKTLYFFFSSIRWTVDFLISKNSNWRMWQNDDSGTIAITKDRNRLFER